MAQPALRYGCEARGNAGAREGVPSTFSVPSDCLRATVRGALLEKYLLSPQQLEILELLADGLSNKQIAARLTLSVRTVEGYTRRLHHALETHGDRAVLVARWLSFLYDAVDALGLRLPPHQPEAHG
jgi:DNA-binding NarL/FixJ family response regulator